MVEWVQINIITVIRILWHDFTLSLSLSLSLQFSGNGEMSLTYVFRLPNKLYEVLKTSIQSTNQPLIPEFYIVHSEPVRWGGLYIDNYPTGFT